MSDIEIGNFDNHEHKKSLETLDDTSRELHDKLREDREKGLEQSQQESLENARMEVEKLKFEQEKNKVERGQDLSTAEKQRGPINRTQRDVSFKTTMSEIQEHMSPAGRSFSRLIHNKSVEKVSDIAGDTIARPNAILAGAIFAFILTLGVYLLAKNFGYPLSGFETIGSFILGWILGIVYDFLKVMVTGRQ